MLMPSIFGENLFDDWMDFPFGKDMWSGRNPLYGKNESRLMKTDVKETDQGYELDIDLPGFKKENVTAALKNGYLTISASKGLDKEDKDDKKHYIRKERYSGQCSRSFYVGEGISQEDVKAKFEDGILRLTIPKAEPEKIEQQKYISIEG